MIKKELRLNSELKIFEKYTEFRKGVIDEIYYKVFTFSKTQIDKAISDRRFISHQEKLILLPSHVIKLGVEGICFSDYLNIPSVSISLLERQKVLKEGPITLISLEMDDLDLIVKFYFKGNSFNNRFGQFFK